MRKAPSGRPERVVERARPTVDPGQRPGDPARGDDRNGEPGAALVERDPSNELVPTGIVRPELLAGQHLPDEPGARGKRLLDPGNLVLCVARGGHEPDDAFSVGDDHAGLGRSEHRDDGVRDRVSHRVAVGAGEEGTGGGEKRA